MKLSAKDLKAINWYLGEHDLKPQLSTPPIIYFTNKKGEQVKAELTGIHSEYNAWNEEDKKQRAREKRIAEKQVQPRVI